MSVAAVSLDVFGTLVYLDAPGPALREELAERLSVEVTAAQADTAFAAEIEYYLAHHLEGGDRESLEGLRERCAGVVAASLAIEGLEAAAVKPAMLAALRFKPFDDVAPALGELRARGVRLVATSNWDCSLQDWLDGVGIAELLDATVSSGDAGVAKPDPALFRLALERVSVEPDRALHVGDSPGSDVEGARAAGIPAVLLARRGDAPEGVTTIRSLGDLPALI